MGHRLLERHRAEVREQLPHARGPQKVIRTLIAKADHTVNRFILRAAPDWKLLRARRNPAYGAPVRGKRVLITGAAGGDAAAFPCELRDLGALDALADKVIKQFGGVDVLVNNAGHSIPRDTAESLERWHDIERAMQINYFSAMRLTRAFLPGMLERSDGHVINVSSWVVPLEAATRFIGYGAAKAAASIAARSIHLEYGDKGVYGSSVHFPLVRTTLIAPTEEHDNLAALTSEEAAEWIVLAARTRVARVMPRIAYFPHLLDLFLPDLARRIIVLGGRGR